MGKSLPKLEEQVSQKDLQNILRRRWKRRCGYRNHAQWNLGRILLYRNMDNGDYASNSGLIVSPRYRNIGLASRIKESVFNVTKKYPNAKLFGITTGLAVMKINSRLGYHPVPFSELTQDDQFWDGCQSCVNYSILQSKGRKNCLTGNVIRSTKRKNKKDLNYYMQNY